MRYVDNSTGALSQSTIPILVVSCDRYADAWPFFFGLFDIYWKECPFPLVLGSNSRSFDRPGLTTLLIGADRSWSTNVVGMLDKLQQIYPNADYILLLLEDFFLKSPVDTGRIQYLVNVARAHEVGCLRLAAGLPLAIPPSTAIPGLADVGVIGSGAPFRITLQASIWRVSTLRKLLAPGLTPWEFEQIGTQLSESFLEPIWGVTRPAMDYDHAIEKGKWKLAGLEIPERAGLRLSNLSREIFSEEQLAEHYDRVSAESQRVQYRSAALRSFLVGRRREGLAFLFRHMLNVRPAPSDLALCVAGVFGKAATRRALSIYVKMRLKACAQREINA